MYIVNHFSNIGVTEVVEINNLSNAELFITPQTVDFWESDPFNKINITKHGKDKF